MKDFIYIIFIIGIIIISINNIIDVSTSCNKQLQNKDSIIEYQSKQIDTLNTIISIAHNSQVLFENIVGVKKSDGIITYKEKCLVTADRIHKLNRYKLN